jgi:hypothetical protein
VETKIKEMWLRIKKAKKRIKRNKNLGKLIVGGDIRKCKSWKRESDGAEKEPRSSKK